MSRVRAGKLVVRDPVLLCGVVYLLLYFDASGFLRLGLLAAVLHELGHIFVYCIQQRHLPVIEVTMTGFCMHTAGERLSPRQRFVLAAAGPAVNFALAGVWAVRLAQTTTIRGSAFWAGSLLAAAVILLAALAVLNFDAAFVLFHHLFFPGKDNWLFDPTTDQIILILPKLFFRNCAIAIAVFLLIGCAALILWDLRRKR